jgi:hypothetical protein
MQRDAITSLQFNSRWQSLHDGRQRRHAAKASAVAKLPAIPGMLSKQFNHAT